MKLFDVIREDTCFICGRDKAIELYDKNNNPIRFPFILDTHRQFLLDVREIRYGECKFCHHRFMLDWTDNKNEIRIPKILSESNFIKYIKQYSKSKVF